MTEEQKDCEYCNFDNYRGEDFAEEGLGCKFQISRFTTGEYYINVWSGLGGSTFDADSDVIHYCPMCGRTLNKENN